ncbi:unnamed protein product, partial [marine sediment metagenome]
TYDPKRVSVTVVDNGSPKETVQVITDHRHKIDNLVLLNKNMGKPYALNLGVSIVNETDVVMEHTSPKYYLFCDNDLSFKTGWIDVMLSTYEEHEEGMNLCALSGVRWPRHQLCLKQGATRQINEYRFPPGCCLLMSADSHDKVGKWDTKKLIMCVDTNYLRRATHLGYKHGSVHPDSVIDHTGKAARSWSIKNGVPILHP